MVRCGVNLRGSSGGGVVPPIPQRICSRRVTTEWPNFYKTANAKWREQQETTPRDTGRKRERSSLLLGHQKRNRGQRAGFAKRPKRRSLFCGGGKGETQQTMLFLQTNRELWPSIASSPRRNPPPSRRGNIQTNKSCCSSYGKSTDSGEFRKKRPPAAPPPISGGVTSKRKNGRISQKRPDQSPLPEVQGPDIRMDTP